jgi:hypothetical protein
MGSMRLRRLLAGSRHRRRPREIEVTVTIYRRIAMTHPLGVGRDQGEVWRDKTDGLPERWRIIIEGTTDYDLIRNACAEAKPDTDFTKERVRLIDVLWIIPSDEVATATTEFDGDLRSDYVDNVFQTVHLWDPSRDDLLQQSPDLLKFVADLLLVAAPVDASASPKRC